MKFKDLSIKKKLIAISMLTAISSLLVVLVFNIVGMYISYRGSISESAMSFARIIGTNCVAPLIFDDQVAAQKTLNSLKTESSVRFARIYITNKEVFAEYISEGEKDTPTKEFWSNTKFNKMSGKGISECRFSFWDNVVSVLMSIESDDKRIGVIEISYNLNELKKDLMGLTSMSILAVLCSIVIAYLVSTVAQRDISGPILTLTQAMENVSIENDYTVRVEKKNLDELGMLIDGFNHMLAEIQERDEVLFFVQQTVENMKDVMYWIDTDGRIVNANASASTTLGYSKEELLSMSINDLDPYYNMDSWKEQWEIFREYKFFSFEAQNISKNGKIIPIEVNINFLKFKDKEYSCAIIRDLTEKKRLTAQLEQAQKMEAIGTLASGVAHDLNNILGAVVGYPQIMLMDLPKDSPLAHNLLMIQASGQKAAAIVQDMLTLARRGVDLQNATNLNEVIKAYAESAEFKALKRSIPGIDVRVDPEKDIPNILGSDFQLSKALMNLVTNAAEAMSLKGGGMVRISSSKRILIKPYNGYQTIPAGQYAVLSVQDTGAGISKEDQSNIFEPFYTKKMMGKSGTGLGMTVVAGVVKDHGGFIDLKSSEKQGTNFDLYFSVTDKTIQGKEEIKAFESYKGMESILVVDDTKEQREVACIVLKKLGYRVCSVTGGEKALTFLRQNRVDLLILDMIMDPGIDGLETYKRVLEIYPGQKAIIATGYAETERVKEAMKLGVGTYIKKPYTIEKLGIAVRRILDSD